MGINVELVKALASVVEGDKETERRVYVELLKSDLLLPVEKVDNPAGGETATVKPLPIQVRGGKVGLPVFSHSQAALKWRPEWKSYVALPAQQIFKMVIDKDLPAIVIDAGSPIWLEVRRPEIESLLQGKIPVSAPATGDLPASAPATGNLSIQNFARGTALVQPHIQVSGTASLGPLSEAARQDLQKGIELLQLSAQADGSLWPAQWFLGKAFQTLDNHEQACKYFENAYAIKSDEADISNELALEYMELGRAAEAIKVLNKSRDLNPKDAGVTANLGLAFLLDDQIVNAKRIVSGALKMDAQDKITKNLVTIIKEIEAGKRPQPRKLSDLKT